MQRGHAKTERARSSYPRSRGGSRIRQSGTAPCRMRDFRVSWPLQASASVVHDVEDPHRRFVGHIAVEVEDHVVSRRDADVVAVAPPTLRPDTVSPHAVVEWRTPACPRTVGWAAHQTTTVPRDRVSHSATPRGAVRIPVFTACQREHAAVSLDRPVISVRSLDDAPHVWYSYRAEEDATALTLPGCIETTVARSPQHPLLALGCPDC
jgi:hypothetical protein